MNVLVRVLSGPDTGRTIPLRSGQVARFGRTEWADFGFPADAMLGDVHFELRCELTGVVVLRNLAASGTLVDGIETAEAVLRPGQKISAGQTTFSVVFESGSGTSRQSGARDASGDKPAENDRGDGETSTVESICSRFELEDDAALLATSGLSPDEFVMALVVNGHLRDALRFQSFRLPKRDAVWWSWRCLSDRASDLPPADTAALDTAHQWLLDPGDETARAAGDAAESLGYGTAAAWVAAAAFWSGDNMAPPVSPAVTPPDHLTGTAVSAAMLLGSLDGDPTRTAARQRAFLDIAAQVAAGDDRPPEPRGSAPAVPANAG